MKYVEKMYQWIPDIIMSGTLFMFWILAGFVTGCTMKPPDSRLEDRLAQIEAGVLFTLDTLQKGDWDSVCVIRPYEDTERALNGKVIGRTEAKTVNQNVLFDHICTLLFLKGDKVSELCTIKRQTTDFASLSDTLCIYERKTVFMMNEDRRVFIDYSPPVSLPPFNTF